jgi:transcriptional regulator with XRE-family HTH domain
MDAGHAVRLARRRASLSQVEVARRSGIAQPSIARIEAGGVAPTVDTLERLLHACGSELRVGQRLGAGVKRAPIRELLGLDPIQRIMRVRRRKGFDPHRLLLWSAARHARFVLVGDAAARAHGAPIAPGLVDVAPDPDPMNRRRLMVALRRLSLRSKRAVPSLRTRGRQAIPTDFGVVRCWWSATGLPKYEELARASDSMLVDGHVVAVACLDDLIGIAIRRGDTRIAAALSAVREERYGLRP